LDFAIAHKHYWPLIVKTPAELPWLTMLADAVWAQHPVRMTCRRWGKTDNVVAREVDLLGLVLKAGVWYLTAAPHGQARMYRVWKILDLGVLDGTFDTPADFDLERAWERSAREFEEMREMVARTARRLAASARNRTHRDVEALAGQGC
jgi:predicted DNA-binding transcriptional regulator YafY